MKKFFLFSVVLLSVFNLSAQEGFPDPSFGNNGNVNLGYGPHTGSSATTFQSDGKFIVVVGSIVGRPFRGGFTLTRFNADGTLDTSFGNGGMVATAIPNIGSSGNGVVVAVQNNGKIVVQVVGGADPPPSFIVALVRFNSNGSLDTTFGTGGIVATFYPSGGIRRLVDQIVIQSDGKIVEDYSGVQAGQSFTVVTRYEADGTPDTSFQTIFTQSYGVGSPLIIQNDGKIVIWGGIGTQSFVERLNSNGEQDASFSRINVINDWFRDMAVHSNGKIVLATGTNKLLRYNADGTPDLSFGSAGMVSSPFLVQKILVQSEGKIITGGYLNAPGANGHFLLARYNPNGTFDPSFGYGGMSAIYLRPNPLILENMAIADNRLYAYGSGYLAAFQLPSQSQPALATTEALQNKAIAEKIRVQKLNVFASPNPATTHFTLRLQGSNNQPVQVRVMNAMGRVVEVRRNMAANTIIILGANYRSGVYYAEIMQGKERITTKLIKGSN